MGAKVWTEKYRPQKLSEVKGQEDIVSRLKAFTKGDSMPHLLFSGPAGVGKTTCALAIARQIYGEHWRDSVLELNASDDRGIDVVRNKVKDFARMKAIDDVPFKIVYLDEADHLTKDAQAALRRTMEDYTVGTRFILSCNYSSKIISPIQSRCAVFRFKPLPKDSVISLLNSICSGEGVKVDNVSLEFIYEASEGDMRKAENILQACSVVSNTINVATVKQVVSFAEPAEVAKMIMSALRGDFIGARGLLHDLMTKSGLSGLDVVKQVQRQVWNLEINDSVKIELVKRVGEYEFRMVEGSNEVIQLTAMLADFSCINR